MPPKPVDVLGQVFGMQKVLEYCGKNSRWLVQCNNCNFQSKQRISNLKHLHVCRNCCGFQKGEVGLKRLHNQYKRVTTSCNRNFELSADEFKSLTSGDCFYCGVKPLQVMGNHNKKQKSTWGHYYYNGIDRKNNNLGYVLKNCVSCCWNCNSAKGKMPYEEFVAWIEQIRHFRSPT